MLAVKVLLVWAMWRPGCCDYTSREVIQSLSPNAYSSLVPLHYDKHTPPATDDQPAMVYFDMKLLDITSVDENDMTFSVESFLTYRWKDWRLKWPLEDPSSAPCWNPTPSNLTSPLSFREVCTGEYTPEIRHCVDRHPMLSKRLILDVKILDDIWQPDAFFKNGIRSSIHRDWVENTYLAIYTSDGHVRLFSRMSVTLSCHFDFHHYPHDEQHCEMVIQSLSYRMDLVRFEWCRSWALAAASHQLQDGIFSLPHFTLAKYEHTVCNGSSNFTCVKAFFLLARHPDFHILHTYIPTVLIVILSWMSFWIKPDATPARVTLGVTSILTMATQYSQSTSNLPPVSYIKSLDVWMITCMVYVFMALLEFALVYHVNNVHPPVEVLPLTITSNGNASNGVTQCVIIRSAYVATPGRSAWYGPEELLISFIKKWRRFWSTAEEIDIASRYFFPITYGIFILGYFSLLMRKFKQEAVSTDIPN